MTESPESLALRMGLDLPDFDRIGYYGADYGTMKPFHRIGNLLFLSGHVAQIGTEITHKGRLGKDLTTEQGYAAARQTGLNVLGGIKQAVGSLDHVHSIVRTLNFVVCAADYEDVHKVSSGLSDLFVEVFGRERGLGGRATIGVMALAGGVCIETWATIELKDGCP
jgi:enamine deaminase RidA (YjgF/YER057c/UK114 family)